MLPRRNKSLLAPHPILPHGQPANNPNNIKLPPPSPRAHINQTTQHPEISQYFLVLRHYFYFLSFPPVFFQLLSYLFLLACANSVDSMSEHTSAPFTPCSLPAAFTATNLRPY